jgi:uncharacterized delta-60 repeat protein
MTHLIQSYSAKQANFTVTSVVSQPDGKILVGGSFTSWGVASVAGLVRINLDGRVDTAFLSNVGTGADFTTADTIRVMAIAVQPDGKILVAGAFQSWNGASVGRMVRLNSDGTRDLSFTNFIVNGNINDIALVSDGIVIGGQFSFITGQSSVGRVILLNPNGTVKQQFGSGANSTVNKIQVQSDGQIIIAGAFTTFNGITAGGIARIKTDRTLDTDFSSNTGTGANSTVSSMNIQPSGQIVLGGFFTTWNGVTVNRIVRLNSDGTRDSAFTSNTGTGPSEVIFSIKTQSDEKIILGGGETLTSFNGTAVNRVVRLNSNGTLDTAFISTVAPQYHQRIESILIKENGQILLGQRQAGSVGGTRAERANSLTMLESNGQINTTYPIGWRKVGVPYIKVGGAWKPAKSTYNKVLGAWRSSFLQGGINDPYFQNHTMSADPNLTLAVQNDGKTIVGGSFTSFSGSSVNRIVRLSKDGSLDSQFITNIGTGAQSQISKVIVQTDQKILLVGSFTSFNGSSAQGIARLNSDGSLDTAFMSNIGTGSNGPIRSVFVRRSDGKIVLSGSFTSFNGTARDRIVMLNSSGTIDTAFADSAGATLDTPAKTMGSFFNILLVATDTKLVALTFSSGAVSSSFTANIGTSASGIEAIETQLINTQTRIILAGSFTSFNGTTANRVVRLLDNGAIDWNYGSGANGTVKTINIQPVIQGLQPNLSVIFGGSFTSFNGTTSNSLVRLVGTGTLDTAFSNNVGLGFNGEVNSIAVDVDEDLTVCGNFTEFNQQTRTNLAKIGGQIAL